MSGPRVAIIGHGKMGRAIEQLALERGWTLVGVVGRGSAVPVADVAIEFTEPSAAVGSIRRSLDAGVPVVSGTTGWYDKLPEISAEVARAKGALLWAPNFSVGAHIFRRMVEDASRRMASLSQFDAHIVEAHHAAKRDAPSGTAAALATAAEKAIGRPIPITSIRTGSIPGTHEILFDAPFEQLRLEHIVRDRRVFAAGALLAAEWLIGKTGVFTLDDVLTNERGPA